MKKLFICLVGALALGLSVQASAASAPSTKSAPIASAQNQTVSGRIVDELGEPVIGASVLVKGTSTGVATDADGRFTVKANSSQTLLISCVGYKAIEVKAGGNLNIVLKEDTELLQEVVVLGYGAAQKKQDLSAAVGIVGNPEELAARPVTSTESMLQGQIAGVTIQANGGDPTSTPSMVIRGQGSRNGDNVLWVVDGVPGAPISSVNDIESIVVLKDAASAAIYGAQSGAGGVVLVTTKQAKEGAVSLSYDGTFGIRNATNLVKGLTAEDQVKMRQLSYANAGLDLPDGWNTSKNPWVGTTRTDWVDEVFRTALYQRHNVSINTGTATFRNRISWAYDDDQGTMLNTFKKSNTFRYNGSFNINKWVTISEDFVWRNSQQRGTNTSSGYSGAYLSAIYMPSSATVMNYDGTNYGGVTTEDPAYLAQYGSLYGDAHGDAINPVRILCAESQFNKSNTAWSTTTLQIANVVPGLKFTSRFTYNHGSNFYKVFTPTRPEIGKPYLTAELTESSYRSSRWKTENTLTYDNSFGKHTVGALLSTTADKYYSRGLEVNASDFADESAVLQYLAYSGSYKASDYLTGPDANVSLIARVAYSFDDRYFMTASWRRDYAGRLPMSNNYGDFPAVTAAWKISNEKFFHKSDAISLLKVRASWGRVGNLGSIPYNYKSALLGKTNWNESAQYGVEKGKTWGSFLYNSTALNPKLTWETSEQWDLGLDLSMFNDRLSVAIDYFNKRTFNLIQQQTMNWPQTIGVDPMYVNLGEVKNSGVEVQLGWNDKVNKNFSYFVNANFAYLKNKVSDTGLLNADGTPGAWTSDDSFRLLTGVYQTEVGQPLNSYFLVKTNGIIKNETDLAAAKKAQPNAQLGDLWFVDYNGDDTIDTKDRQHCGNATPKTTFALTGGFTWKKLSGSIMLQGVGGAQALYVGKNMLLSDVEGSFNRSSEILNAWSPQNPDSNIPRLSKNDPNQNFTIPSDWYLEDASYVRIKNITLSYDLSDQLRKVSHFAQRNSSLSLYLSGENLATFTSYSGVDPECGGWDALKYPVSRVFSIGVKLTY